MKELFVSDLDGTLLDNEGRISSFSRQSLIKIITSGVLFTLATARSIYSVKEILCNIDLPLPFIGGNGTLISDFVTGRHHSILTFSAAEIGVILDQAVHTTLSPVAALYTQESSRIVYGRIANAGMEWCITERQEAGDARLVHDPDPAKLVSEPVVSLTFIGSEEETGKLRRSVAAVLPDVSVVLYENTYSPGWFWLSFQHGSANKGSALKRLLTASGLQDTRVIAFGDNHNDLPLFQAAGYAVAVANAPEAVRLAADEVIGYNHQDAVMRYILERTQSV